MSSNLTECMDVRLPLCMLSLCIYLWFWTVLLYIVPNDTTDEFQRPLKKRAWPNLDNRHLMQGSAENRKKPQVDRCSGRASCEMKLPWHYLKYYPSSQLEGLRENHENVRPGHWFLGRELKPDIPSTG
jgi:hypothetical protein